MPNEQVHVDDPPNFVDACGDGSCVRCYFQPGEPDYMGHLDDPS